MDVHVRREITEQLRRRGVDVLTSQDDGTTLLDDDDLLARASAIGRVLFSQDSDLLAEATKCQRDGIAFFGLIYAHQLNVTIGQCIEDLELIAKVYDPADIAGLIEYLPL
jgi:hypothetical protein